MPSINHAIASIDAVLSGQRSRADADFNEADHPRASNEQFGSGGGSSGGGSGGAPSRPKPANSKGFFGSIKEAFSGSPAHKAEERQSKAKADLEEAMSDVLHFSRLAREAKPSEKRTAEAKAKEARRAADKAERELAAANKEYEDRGPEAEAKAEKARKAEEDRYWASKRGPHPLDKAKK